MKAVPVNAIALDLHQLDGPNAQARVQHPEQVRRLMASIDADGQRVPLVVVAEDPSWVLVDGYQRWAALQRLGRDTAQVEVWEGPLVADMHRAPGRCGGVETPQDRLPHLGGINLVNHAVKVHGAVLLDLALGLAQEQIIGSPGSSLGPAPERSRPSR